MNHKTIPQAEHGKLYTSEERAKLRAPEPEMPDDRPREVMAAEAAMNEASGEYEKAVRVYQQAAVDYRAVCNKPSRQPWNTYGTPEGLRWESPRSQEIREAAGKVKVASGLLENALKELAPAKVEYNRLLNNFQLEKRRKQNEEMFAESRRQQKESQRKMYGYELPDR